MSVLVVLGVGCTVAAEVLWAEWLLFIAGNLLGWVLACGPGRPWQRLLVCWVLAIIPIALVATPVGIPGRSFFLLRGQMMFLGALQTSLVLFLAEPIWQHTPVWRGSSRGNARQWTIADWMVLTVLLSTCLVVDQYLVEEVWLLGGWLEPSEQLGRWDYWWLLLRQLGWQAVLQFATAVTVVLPLSVLWSRWPQDRSSLPDFPARAAGLGAIFCSPLLLFFPTRVALEWLALIETLVVVVSLFLISTRPAMEIAGPCEG